MRDDGAPKLSQRRADWGAVRATLIRRERVAEVEQRFTLPFHVFRLGVSGGFATGSTTAIGAAGPVALPSKPGQASFYPCGCTILNHVSRASRLTYLTVEIEPELAHGLTEAGAVASGLLPAAAVSDLVVHALLRSLVPPEAHGPAPERLYAEQAALLLLVAAARAGGNATAPARHRGGLTARQLEHVTDYLRENMAQSVSLGELARLVGLSSSHLCRAFRQSTGQTPHRWLLGARIEYARTLLARSRLPLAEIALAAGFANQSSFTTAFRRETGRTPGRWRREEA